MLLCLEVMLFSLCFFINFIFSYFYFVYWYLPNFEKQYILLLQYVKSMGETQHRVSYATGQENGRD